MDLAELEVLLLAQTVSLVAAHFLSKTYRLVIWAACHHSTDAAGGAAILMLEIQWEFHQSWALQVHQHAAGARSSGGNAMATGLSLLVRRMRTGSYHLRPQTSLMVISPPAMRTMAASRFGAARSMPDALLTETTAGHCPFGGAAQHAAQVETLAADRQGGNSL